jgi:hypothetical protein
VVIVTNAEDGWVEETCERFLPALQPLLQKLDIVSARSSYGDGVPTSEWKRRAFADLAKNSDGLANIVSIGDAEFERDAVLSVAPVFGCSAKSLKLAMRPDLGMMQQQHAFLQARFAALARRRGNLDLRVEPDLLGTSMEP